jgi:hypothetical protein
MTIDACPVCQGTKFSFAVKDLGTDPHGCTIYRLQCEVCGSFTTTDEFILAYGKVSRNDGWRTNLSRAIRADTDASDSFKPLVNVDLLLTGKY